MSFFPLSRRSFLGYFSRLPVAAGCWRSSCSCMLSSSCRCFACSFIEVLSLHADRHSPRQCETDQRTYLPLPSSFCTARKRNGGENLRRGSGTLVPGCSTL